MSSKRISTEIFFFTNKTQRHSFRQGGKYSTLHSHSQNAHKIWLIPINKRTFFVFNISVWYSDIFLSRFHIYGDVWFYTCLLPKVSVVCSDLLCFLWPTGLFWRNNKTVLLCCWYIENCTFFLPGNKDRAPCVEANIMVTRIQGSNFPFPSEEKRIWK